MVSNASDDLPDPDTPVITVNFSWGMESEMFLRLWTRAPWILIKSSTGILIIRLRSFAPSRRAPRCHSRTRVLPEPPPPDALRLPSPSAIIAVTRVLRLTPSCSARVTRRECSDLGERVAGAGRAGGEGRN